MGCAKRPEALPGTALAPANPRPARRSGMLLAPRGSRASGEALARTSSFQERGGASAAPGKPGWQKISVVEEDCSSAEAVPASAAAVLGAQGPSQRAQPLCIRARPWCMRALPSRLGAEPPRLAARRSGQGAQPPCLEALASNGEAEGGDLGERQPVRPRRELLLSYCLSWTLGHLGRRSPDTEAMAAARSRTRRWTRARFSAARSGGGACPLAAAGKALLTTTARRTAKVRTPHTS